MENTSIGFQKKIRRKVKKPNKKNNNNKTKNTYLTTDISIYVGHRHFEVL